MRAPVAMAALIDDEGARGDVHLVSAEVVDDVGAGGRGVNAAFRRETNLHRAHTTRRRVEDQEFRASRIGQTHRRRQHSLAIGAGDSALSEDDDAVPVPLVGVILRFKPLQRGAVVAILINIIGQVRRRADARHAGAVQPGLADTGVQHRRLDARVGPDQQDPLRRVDIGDVGRADDA